MVSFTILLAVSTLIDAAAAAGALVFFAGLRKRSASRPCFGLRDVLAVAAVACAVFALKAPVLSWAGLDRFGLLNAVFLSSITAPPLLGVLMLVFAKWGVPRVGGVKFRRIVLVPAWAFLLPWPVAIYGTCVEPFRLQTERADFAFDSLRGASPVRVGVLADLQFAWVTDCERGAIARMIQKKGPPEKGSGSLLWGVTTLRASG